MKKKRYSNTCGTKGWEQPLVDILFSNQIHLMDTQLCLHLHMHISYFNYVTIKFSTNVDFFHKFNQQWE
jgi:hypothetical protein